MSVTYHQLHETARYNMQLMRELGQEMGLSFAVNAGSGFFSPFRFEMIILKPGPAQTSNDNVPQHEP